MLKLSKNPMIGGVCGGIANSLRIDPIFVRLGVLILFFSFDAPIFAIYLILWLLLSW
jgi:phage shock protein PspC (stress-responsive transcriptional regulator)